MSTKTYEKKRNLSRSGEPRGGKRRSSASARPRFVIQAHDATTLHYDFRLEAGGVLKSWAVPKGLSTDPREKRLAIRTEDHPLDYRSFEGVIPEGEYGAGTVIVWDQGTYENITGDDSESITIDEALTHGHVVVRLRGKKLSGGYALQRIESGDHEKWLIIKVDDAEADARRNPVSTQPESVRSGKTLAAIARENRQKEDGSS